jgi:DNA-binding XRE family transcriptional regulator
MRNRAQQVSRDRLLTDRLRFAAQMRAARAVLGWSQTELGKKAKVTQRAIYRLEKGVSQPRHLTRVRIDQAFQAAGIEIIQKSNGGFEMTVPDDVLARPRRKAAAQR